MPNYAPVVSENFGHSGLTNFGVGNRNVTVSNYPNNFEMQETHVKSQSQDKACAKLYDLTRIIKDPYFLTAILGYALITVVCDALIPIPAISFIGHWLSELYLLLFCFKRYGKSQLAATQLRLNITEYHLFATVLDKYMDRFPRYELSFFVATEILKDLVLFLKFNYPGLFIGLRFSFWIFASNLLICVSLCCYF